MRKLLPLLLLFCNAILYGQSGTTTTTYYPNGDIVENAEKETDTIYPCSQWMGIGRFVNNKKEGYWQYFCNNVPMYTGTYRAGKKEGKWKMEWSAVLHYKNDLLEGEAVWYFPGNRGVIQEKRHYHNGLADGDWVVYDESGKIIETRHYQDNVPVGLWEIHEGTLTRKGPVNEYGPNGLWRVTSYDTLIGGGTYINGLQQGNWTDVLSADDISIGHYINGRRNGLWRMYFRNTLVRCTEYKDGLRHGADTNWTDKEISAINHWYEGNWDGTATTFFADGKKHTQYVYDRGSRATYTEYGSNGKQLTTGQLAYNPDYLLYEAQLKKSCRLAVPYEFEFELMERGICTYSCVMMGHEQPSVSIDSVAAYLQSAQFRQDTAGPHKAWGTPEYVPSGVWISYYPEGKKKEEGEYLPKFEVDPHTGEPNYIKTGWWKVYDERGKWLRDELYENGMLTKTQSRKK